MLHFLIFETGFHHFHKQVFFKVPVLVLLFRGVKIKLVYGVTIAKTEQKNKNDFKNLF